LFSDLYILLDRSASKELPFVAAGNMPLDEDRPFDFLFLSGEGRNMQHRLFNSLLEHWTFLAGY
jgi:hypothetical protein